MARIDQEEIDRIKRETDIVALIQSSGTTLKRRESKRGEWIGCCPVHDDKDPSLCVNSDKNVWICNGECKTGGDVIQWVMHAKKCSFLHAVDLLREDAVNAPTKFGNPRKLECPLPINGNDQELLLSTVNYYHDRLKQNPDALEYLEKRGLVHPELIDKFKIGFVDRSLGLRIPPKQGNKTGSTLRDGLERVGILRETGHEHLRGCVTFPLMNATGQIVQIYGRRLDNGGKSKQRHFYLPSPLAGIFNGEALKAYEEIILCESIIDALTFWVAGYRNVTCTFGTNGLTDELFDAIQNSDIRRILIAFDNDNAGNHSADELSKKLNAIGIDAFRVKFPSGQDANEYASKLKMGRDNGEPGHASLGLAIRNAEWIANGDKTEPTITTITPNFLKDARDAIAREAIAKPNPNEPQCASTGLAAEPQVSSLTPQACNNPSLLAAEAAKPATPSQPEASASGPTATVPTVAKQQPQEARIPDAPKPTIEAEIRENEIVIPIGNRSYRVRGLEKNLAFDVLKVNILVRKAEQFYIDTFDIYAARQRSIFIKEAARELLIDEETIKRDLGKVLLKLEELQDKTISDAQAIKQEKIEITDADKAAAMALLKDENLLDKILDDFEGCGVVGERTNKLVGYLAATSRKLDRPLAIMVQSSSAAGKSSLMEAILRFLPGEEQVTYSAMTGQSLFYMGGMNLKNKVLAIAEEEGIRQASYALKLLQSEGQLTIASTGKDPGTGRMETQEYHVEGPVMIFLTTTAIDVDEELLNRCLVLTVDEDREQTRAIQRQQRLAKTIVGLRASQQKTAIVKLHQNAQRLLRPLAVVNNYADQLNFLDDQTRRRRDHTKYLTLIEAVALLHQYQRPVHTMNADGGAIQYIEVTPRDIAIANTLAEAVLGRSIDELPPQTRRLLRELYEWARRECEAKKIEQAEYRFSRRTLREALGWSQTAIKRHLERLLEMEYVIPHRAGARASEYELLYDGRGREGQPTICGLIDPSKLQPITTTTGPMEPSSTHPNGCSSQSEPSSSPQEHSDNTGSSTEKTSSSSSENNGEGQFIVPMPTTTNTEAPQMNQQT
ncbi:MAG: CHC2 zinc finger domain-containing protein [Pirellula sp.]|jgi:DNA primase